MKLFFFYAFRSLKNQIRKLLKTWVLIFILACALLGGVLGFGAAKLSEKAEEQEEITETEPEEELPPLPERLGVESGDLFELIGGVLTLAFFSYQLFSAEKNGGRIFQSADVNLLFASPLRPQSVLLFRLMTQLGTAVFMVFYLLLQLPNLTLNMGLTVPAALGLIVGLCAAALTGKLLQMLLYVLCSTHPALNRSARKWGYALLGAAVGGYILFHTRSGLGVWQSACAFVNAPAARLIPFWGTLKAFFRAAVEGRLWAALGWLGLLFALQAGLIAIIYRLPADFYEDAMARSEETAELRRRAQGEETSVAMKKRKKDRPDSVLRDGLRRGSGADVFFWKNMYNRRRFARFGFLTKTGETYLFAALGVGLLCLKVWDADPLLPVMLTLCGFSYFRALGNPLETDTSMGFYVLVPEPMEKKLFFSLLSAGAECLLDLLPAGAVCAALCGGRLGEIAAWIVFALSVTLYATVVGAFINLSVPVSAGKLLKSIVQVMFVYFGLVPDAALLAVGIVNSQLFPSALGAAALNLLLGLIFFTLTPLYLDPPCDPPRCCVPYAGSIKEAKRCFSRVGWGLTVILGGGSAMQLLTVTVLNRLYPDWASAPYALWFVTFLPLYLAAFPAGMLLLRSLPAKRPEKGEFSLWDGAAAVLVSIFFMYVGNLLGTLLTTALSFLPKIEAANPLLTYTSDSSSGAKLLVFVVVAPVLEETVFRRLLIDRLRLHGDRLAVVCSALFFGLFHGNLSQFFYAAALGLVFGYVYLRTGRLWCPLGLHMLINLMGGIVAPSLLAAADLSEEALASIDSLAALLRSSAGHFFLYVLLLLCCSAAGLTVYLRRKQTLRFAEDELTLPKGRRFTAVWGNWGMPAFLLCSLGLTVYSLL